MKSSQFEFVFSILFIILIYLTIGCNDRPSSNLMQVSESGLTFDLPGSWRKITGQELDSYRQQIQDQNYTQARALGFTNPEDFKIQQFTMFSATEGEIAAVVVMMMQIPPIPEKSYLDMIYESMGSQIYLKFDKVFVFRKTEIDQTPVVESDVEGSGGSRIISFNFWSPATPSQAAFLQVMIAPGYFSEYKPVIDSLFTSLHVSLQKQNVKE